MKEKMKDYEKKILKNIGMEGKVLRKKKEKRDDIIFI